MRTILFIYLQFFLIKFCFNRLFIVIVILLLVLHFLIDVFNIVYWIDELFHR